MDTTIDLYTDFGPLEGVPATFDVEVETFPAEPYSWGGSRGTETEVSARFKSMQLNGLTLRENEAIAAFGLEQINALEAQIEENYECLMN